MITRRTFGAWIVGVFSGWLGLRSPKRGPPRPRPMPKPRPKPKEPEGRDKFRVGRILPYRMNYGMAIAWRTWNNRTKDFAYTGETFFADDPYGVCDPLIWNAADRECQCYWCSKCKRWEITSVTYQEGDPVIHGGGMPVPHDCEDGLREVFGLDSS